MKYRSIVFDDGDEVSVQNELKSCPFCGGKPKVYVSASRDYVVSCSKCGAITTGNYSSSLVGTDEALASAIRTWQHRVEIKDTKPKKRNAK